MTTESKRRRRTKMCCLKERGRQQNRCWDGKKVDTKRKRLWRKEDNEEEETLISRQQKACLFPTNLRASAIQSVCLPFEWPADWSTFEVFVGACSSPLTHQSVILKGVNRLNTNHFCREAVSVTDDTVRETTTPVIVLSHLRGTEVSALGCNCTGMLGKINRPSRMSHLPVSRDSWFLPQDQRLNGSEMSSAATRSSSSCSRVYLALSVLHRSAWLVLSIVSFSRVSF